MNAAGGSAGTSPSCTRRRVLERVVASIPAAIGQDCVRVGIDGVDGSGKTVFADELAEMLLTQCRPVLRISADDFLNPPHVRYRLGRDSPEGFFRDSYDYPRLIGDVLIPLAAGGSRRFRRTAPVQDTSPASRWQCAEPGTVLVLDGMFLHRDELAGIWDLSVFLDVPFAVTLARMHIRDGSNPDPEHPSMNRYVGGQRIYLRQCQPMRRAHLVIDNSDFWWPAVVKRNNYSTM